MALTQTCVVGSENLSFIVSIPDCSILSTNSVVVSNMFYSQGYEPTMGKIQLTFPDLLINPSYVKVLGQCTLQTMLLKGKSLQAVDEASVVNPYSIVPALLDVQLDVSPDINAHFPTKLRVDFKSESAVLANSEVLITFPSEFSILNSHIVRDSCLPELGFTTTVLLCSIQANTLLIRNGFDRDIESETTISFSVEGFESPHASGMATEPLSI